MENFIIIAYQAHELIPLCLYRQNLLKAMKHLGESGQLTFEEAHRQVVSFARDRQGEPCIQQIEVWENLLGQISEWDELLVFLNALETFLKAGPDDKRKGKEEGMRSFEHREKQVLLPKQTSITARSLASDLLEDADIVKNKLKKMGAHVTAARDKWEALAALARFYPRSGIPRGYVNSLVEQLETTDLRTFKQIVAQSLIFYEANQIDRGGKN